uniref:Uncharacterized protein n=1 Tax=Glossina austeni TaxID=7395 RepID=A0A1A9V431_GLOAU
MFIIFKTLTNLDIQGVSFSPCHCNIMYNNNFNKYRSKYFKFCFWNFNVLCLTRISEVIELDYTDAMLDPNLKLKGNNIRPSIYCVIVAFMPSMNTVACVVNVLALLSFQII